MIKVIDYGALKRAHKYYKVECEHCCATLIFEYADIWWDDYSCGFGRVECPVCRTKTHFSDLLVRPCDQKDFMLEHATKEEYDEARQDTSDRTLKMLQLEKEKEEIFSEDT